MHRCAVCNINRSAHWIEVTDHTHNKHPSPFFVCGTRCLEHLDDTLRDGRTTRNRDHGGPRNR